MNALKMKIIVIWIKLIYIKWGGAQRIFNIPLNLGTILMNLKGRGSPNTKKSS